MTGTIWLAIGLGILGIFGYRAGRIWADSSRRKVQTAYRIRWAVQGTLQPHRYWWGARIGTLSSQERSELLDRETRALGLSRADSLRCPLCHAEVPGAWALSTDGRPTMARGPIECPACDFRLDACRHCAHFLPGSHTGGPDSPWFRGDMSFGRCQHYQTSQPVEQVCTQDMARRLKARGIEHVRAPRHIVDSFVPPTFCRAYTPERRRLREGGIHWPTARHAALLRLLLSPPGPGAHHAEVQHRETSSG
jgi:hypothetical protein